MISKKIIGTLLLTIPLVAFSSTKSVLSPPLATPLNPPVNTLISTDTDSSFQRIEEPTENTIENEEMVMCLKFHKDGDVINIYDSLIKVLELEKTKYTRISSDLNNQLITTEEELETLEYSYKTNRIKEEDYNYKREDIILQYLLAYEDYVTQLSTLKLQYNEFYKSLNFIKNNCEKGLSKLLVK